MIVEIDIITGCYCNLRYCPHKFRAWSQAWFEGARKRMPLFMEHPFYLFRTEA